MKKNTIIVIVIIGVVILAVVLLSLKRPYDVPEVITIEPSQTAFLIPLTGQISNQKEFMSEQFLQDSKIATKQIEIPHRWLQQGGWPSNGRYIPSMKLILVERKPETREWTESQNTGTSVKNEGITAESKESIGFMARMNCSAQIDEGNAVRFLYRYNNKGLSDVMDTEVRAIIESKFVEECAKLNLDQILVRKQEIMQTVRDNVVPYFKERGITISVIGMKGELTYLNPDIQKSIDAKFESAQSLITQKNENERILSKAKADAEAMKIQSSSLEKSIQLQQIQNQKAAIDKWDGKMPQYITGSGGGSIFNIPIK